MSEVQSGSTVRLHYSVRIADGTTVDSSEGREPLEFEVGAGRVIAGFDNGVLGMTTGEKKTFDVAPGDAYGEYQKDLVAEIPKEHAPDELEVGHQVQLEQEDGSKVVAHVVSIDEESITIDANHPLAGESLTFDIEVVEVSGGEGPKIILP